MGADMDSTSQSHIVTVQFDKFSSHLNGIMKYEWAVGRTPGGEEDQPFISAGIVHREMENDTPGNGNSKK